MNRKILFLTVSMISVLFASAAQAGFEWTPAPAKMPAQNASSRADSTMDSGAGDGPLTPMPGEIAMAPTARVEPVMESEIMDNGPKTDPVTQTRPGMRSIGAPQSLASNEVDTMLPVPGENSSDATIVEGFGRDIPLAVALRQVVPPVYEVAFGSGVDQGKPVSWKGGKIWTSVVSDMLKSRRLHAAINGNTISVLQGKGPDLQIQAPVMQGPMAMADPAPMRDAGKPVLDMTMQKHWTAPAGQSLKQTLESWSGQASVELAWQGAKDSPISSAFSYDGTFDQAVDALLSLYSGESDEPHGKLYPNLPEGPSVLVIGSN